MANIPTCKYCNITLKWPAWTGTPQRPVEQSGKEHDCPKFAGKGKGKYQGKSNWVKYDMKDEDFDFCKFCGRFCYKESLHIKYPALNYISLDMHINRYHPNGEIMDFIDYKILTKEDEEAMRKKWNHPRIEGEYYLEGKILRQDGNKNDIFTG